MPVKNKTEYMKNYWKTPKGQEQYKKKLVFMKDYNQRPEVKKRHRINHGKRMKEYRKNPEFVKNERRRNNINGKILAIKAKDVVLNHYGKICYCCGENIIELLTIDHSKLDGGKFRRDLNIHGGYKFYRWIIRNNFPSDLRTACWNCNCGARFTGICPHQNETK
jgi:hypothetical protein